MVNVADVQDDQQQAPTLEQLSVPAEETQAAPQEQPVGESTEAQEQAPGTTDWKAEAERVKAEAKTLRDQVAKLENDKRSRDGYRNWQAERDAQIRALDAKMEALTKSNSAVVNKLASGDTTGIAEEVQGIQQEAARNVATTRFESAYNALREQMQTTLTGSEGETNLTQTPEMGSVVERWNAELQRVTSGESQDLGAFMALNAQAASVRSRLEVAEVRRELAESQKREKEATKEALDAANVNDLSTSGGGAPAGGGAATKDNIDALYVKNPGKYEEQYRRYLKTGQIS